MKVSVIIPAFRCAKTIKATVDSIREQTFPDWELLLIDDGSDDNTPQVLAELAALDERITVHTLTNGGPARARNAGMELAKGEYIYFMDSDDLALPEMLEGMVKAADEKELDVVCCGYRMERLKAGREASEPGAIVGMTIFSHPTMFALTAAEFRDCLIEIMEAHLLYAVWNKLYRTAFLRKHGFIVPDFFNGEDRLFNLRMLTSITRFGVLEEAYYRYFVRPKSLAGRYVETRFESAVFSHRTLLETCVEMGIVDNKSTEKVCLAFMKTVLACFTQLHQSTCTLTRAQKLQIVKNILDNPEVQLAMLEARPQTSGLTRIANKLCLGGSPFWVYNLAGVIAFTQIHFNSLFIKLKSSKKS